MPKGAQGARARGLSAAAALKSTLIRWLREENSRKLQRLWQRAHALRLQHCGDTVHLRGLVEASSYCRRHCHYCGLRAPNRSIPRYRLSQSQIVACAHEAVRLGFGSLVIQAGEDPRLTPRMIEATIRRIKAETPLALTLSLGAQPLSVLARWRAAGADRYLLRFETSAPHLLPHIHPAAASCVLTRFEQLQALRSLGYEVGTGFMVGLPGQTFDDLAEDLLLLRRIAPDMIGLGPYIPHPSTPLVAAPPAPDGQQVPATVGMALKALALARILCPLANIPATTALAVLDPRRGRRLALARGANVIMPNISPPSAREQYQIYPGKACLSEAAGQSPQAISRAIRRMGYCVSKGPGTSPAMIRRLTICENPIRKGNRSHALR